MQSLPIRDVSFGFATASAALLAVVAFACSRDPHQLKAEQQSSTIVLPNSLKFCNYSCLPDALAPEGCLTHFYPAFDCTLVSLQLRELISRGAGE